MQVLRKRLSRKLEDGKETIVNEYIKKELLTKEDLYVLDDWFDDYEAANDAGIWFDRVETVSLIELSILVEVLKEIVEDKDNEDLSVFDDIRSLWLKLIPWKEYDLHFEDDKNG